MRFTKIDTSEALELFVNKKSKTLLRRIRSYHDRYKFSMNIKPSAHKKDGSIKLFCAMGVLKIKSLSEIRAKYESPSPEIAVKRVIDSLEKQIRRYSEKSERSRSTLGKSLKPIRKFKIEITQ